jgi:hypothetical protein
MNNKTKIIKIDQSFSDYKIPQFEESINKSKGWVEYGEDNQFPYYLISLIAKSPRHASIVKKKAMLIGGRGFLKVNLQSDTMEFIANKKNEYDLEEILSKISYDLELFGGFALNIIWSKDRTKISEINYIDVSKLRVAIPDPDQPDEEKYFICDGWENTRKYSPVLYDAFSTVNRKQASQILYVKGHRAGTEFYAQPDYLPAIYWMEMELKISEYHLSQIIRGFHPSFHINWPIGNSAGDEEMDELVRRLKMQFSGSTNAGESFISFSEDENKPTITPIQENSSDEKFIGLDELIEKGILHSHRVNNPELFGIQDRNAGKLGNAKSDRIESMMEFEIDYVIPQQRILEKIINKIAAINGLTDKLSINKYTDAYKKVGTDSSTDILNIISNQFITPRQKYYMLMSLNYDHNVSSNLSGYTDAYNEKNTNNNSNTSSVIKQHKHNFADTSNDGPADIHQNCRCYIEDDIFISESDCCDECDAARSEWNDKNK